jgi:hypothetical protein
VITTLLDVTVAAVFAALGIFGGVVGCQLVLLLGFAGLVVGVRRHDATGSISSPLGGHWRRWIVCVIAYAVFALLLAPFAQWPAVAVVLLLLSPLFGSMACVVGMAIRAS